VNSAVKMPPDEAAELPAIVPLRTRRSPKFSIPPPSFRAELETIVLLTRRSVPSALEIAPPSVVEALPLNVLPVASTTPSRFKIAPPRNEPLRWNVLSAMATFDAQA
jgi:hypothetical protein